MLKEQFSGWLGARKDLRRKRRDRAAVRYFVLESLDQRIVPAVTAKFAAGSGLLTIVGDNKSNQITVSTNAGGKLLINNGAVKIKGGKATLAKAKQIQVLAKGGDDVITLNEGRSPLPRANVYGGDG